LLEQLKFTTARQLREAEQKLQEALTEERMSRAGLLILGYPEKEIDALDPLAEGEAVAHYPIHAPFAGTVINKHAVLSEFVGPQHQLYEIADLSKVWIHADVFEKDLAALSRMTSKTLTFRAAGYPDREFTAEIFHTGNAVDEKTRAVTLVAAADNPDGMLKPGMFVEVVLPVGTARKAVQIPSTAVQHENHETYVFVAVGNEEFERRPIRTGRSVGGVVEVVDGLKPGDRIVVEGGFALKSELLRDQLVE
jgi:RND family efflux transporter MFP subunit